MRIRTQQLSEFGAGYVRNRLESWAVAGNRAGIEYRYPLLDKRIVEFALGLPPQMYRLEGHSRYLFRAAVTGTIPDEVCWHDIKSEPHRVWEVARLLVQTVQKWELENAMLGSRYIDLGALRDWIASIPRIGETDYTRKLEKGPSALKSAAVADFELECSGSFTGRSV
jgi:asparagine synthase (glutamine-hydrolysing)